MMSAGHMARRMILAAALVSGGTTCATDQLSERPFVEQQVSSAHEGVSQDEFGISLIDSSNCVKEAAVHSYLYRRAGRGRMLIKSKVADLAAIHLERELENTVVEGRLGGGVLLKEELTLVGYGATAPDANDVGTRRFGRNIVTEIRLADDRNGQEIRFRFPGAHTHSGDSGGPCFREQGTERWLVGINGGYVSQGRMESWFTSIESHREWIQKQIEESRKPEVP